MRLPSALLALLALPHASLAQTLVVDSARVAFVGLVHRRPEAVVAAVRAQAPSEPFHACQAVLTGPLRFPEASVVFYDGGLVVTLIEPEEAARVRYRTVSGPQQPLPTDWLPALRAVATPSLVVNAARGWARWGAGRLDSAEARIAGHPEEARARSRQYWAALRPLTRGDDWLRARRMLATDPSPHRRMVAAGVLATRADDPATWHALVQALRDPEWTVRSTAMQALLGLSERSPAPVDWSPVAGDLRWLLNGTNVSDFPFLGLVLVRTAISPTLARRLLAGNGNLLSATLAVSEPLARDRALALVAQLAGQRFPSADDARAWLERLN